jgi:hypothetical protein
MPVMILPSWVTLNASVLTKKLPSNLAIKSINHLRLLMKMESPLNIPPVNNGIAINSEVR